MNMIKTASFQQFIITEFSFRDKDYMAITQRDPLLPKLLEHRFKLFEIACLPSILSQDEQDFTWILIVDKDLPEKYRIRLEKLISVRPNSILHVHDSKHDLGHLDWLESYMDKKPDYVITTKLDDDDAIFTGHTKYVRDHLQALLSNKTLPPIYIFGSYNVVLWDFFYTKNARLGYKKSRPKVKFPVSTGLSVCCKYPEMNFSIFQFAHDSFHILADDSKHFDALEHTHQKAILNIREAIKKSALESGLNWEGILKTQDNFHVFETENPAALVMNHFQIGQYSRILASEYERRAVDSHAFPSINIDFKKASSYIKNFRFSIKTIFKISIQVLKINPQYMRSYGFIKKGKARILLLKQVLGTIRKLDK